MKKYSWKKYNLDQIKVIKNLINRSNKSNLNYIHKKKYNHVRDMFALSLSLLNFKPVILDFGGSSLSFLDVVSKTQVKFSYFLYNPFFDNNKINFINSIKQILLLKTVDKRIINNNKINFIYCNSVIQYIKNINKNFIRKCITKHVKYILLTDVYITLEKRDFLIKQKNHDVNIKIRNIENLEKIFKKNKYKIIFKSAFKRERNELKKSTTDYYLYNFLFQRF